MFLIEKENKKQLNILELGAGTALPSIFLNLFNNSHVVISDIKKNVQLIRDNLELNNIKSNYLVEELDWEHEDHCNVIKSKNEKEYDYIIGSEITYMEECFDSLISVLIKFCTKDTKIVLSYKIRLPEMVENFLNKFSVYFDYYIIEESFVLKHFPLKNKLKILVGTLRR